MIDFKKDLRQATIEQLQMYGIEFREKQELRLLLIKLYTFWEKYILPKKRGVLVSKELAQALNDLPDSVQDAIEKMKEWINNGIDINCFQSRGLYGKGNRDYQNMVYGIVHLHLSAKKNDITPVIKKTGFAKPGEYLLLAYFDATHAYFIDVKKHPQKDNLSIEKWIEKRLFEIMVSNWPEIFKNKKLEGAMLCDNKGNTITIDDNDLSQLTLGHVNTYINLGNDLYMPSFGQTLSGDSLKAVLNANSVINDAIRAQMYYEKNIESINKEFIHVLRLYNRSIPKEFDIHYRYSEDLNQFVIVDRISGIAMDYKHGKIYLFSGEDKYG